jgi:hypothetical protein
MIPIVIPTWLRQLEEYFFKYEEETWAVLGDYLGNEKAEPKNLFGNVMLKNKSKQTCRVREYSDIKPGKTFKNKTSHLYVFRRMGNVSPKMQPSQIATRSYTLR